MTLTAAHLLIHTLLRELSNQGVSTALHLNEGLLPTGSTPLGHGLIDQGDTVTFTVSLSVDRDNPRPLGSNQGHLRNVIASACAPLHVEVRDIRVESKPADWDGSVRLYITTTRPLAL